MALKLKYSEAEHTIRSVGSEPNGILMIGGDDEAGATFAINPNVPPPPRGLLEATPQGSTLIASLPGNVVAEGGAHPITASEAVEACADREAVTMLWKTIATATVVRAEDACTGFTPEDVVAFAKLAVEVRDAMVERGEIHEEERPS